MCLVGIWVLVPSVRKHLSQPRDPVNESKVVAGVTIVKFLVRELLSRREVSARQDAMTYLVG